jgi:hypothetical protein
MPDNDSHFEVSHKQGSGYGRSKKWASRTAIVCGLTASAHRQLVHSLNNLHLGSSGSSVAAVAASAYRQLVDTLNTMLRSPTSKEADTGGAAIVW